MVQEQCCSSGQWVWANICTEVSTPISWSGRAVSTQHWREAHTCHGSCCHPIHHTAPSSFWEESKRILRPPCAIAAMGAKEKEPGVNWDHLN